MKKRCYRNHEKRPLPMLAFSLRETAKVLGCSVAFLQRQMAQGTIHPVRRGRRWFFGKWTIEEFLGEALPMRREGDDR